MDLQKLFQDLEPQIIEDRRWFHRNPELSLQEEKTSAKIREELDGLGIPYEVLAPNLGVMATIEGGKPGKTLLLRADIDALPVTEDTGFDYASETPGIMHACGHDAHAAMLLGAARALVQCKDELAGTVLLLFQVAEETGFGYQEVLDYLEARGGVDGIAGLHIWSTLPNGEILLLPGSIFAGGQGFRVDIKGRGGHGARPDLVKDPIKAMCDLVLQFSSIPTNYYDVLDHSVVSTCLLQAGTLGNIFPSEASFSGTVRYYKPDGLENILNTMERMCQGVGLTHDVECILNNMGGVPPVNCDPEMVAQAKALVPDVAGLCIATQTDPISAGDNYGFLLQKYPGFYGILGAEQADENGEVYPQHHAKFALAEDSFRKGAEFITRYALDFLK